MHFRRDSYVYVGVDLHKKAHVSVMVDSYGEQMGKATKFDNSPAAFPKWLEQVKKRAGERGVMFGLEDCHGLGRALAKFLLEQGEIVKFVNAYATKKERDSVNKSDALDALAVGRVTAQRNVTLPDADLDPLQFALISTVSFRKGLVEEVIRVKNRLHAMLLQAWPDYEGFFSEPFDSKTALAFWETYPSAYRLRGVTLEGLTTFLREQSHYAMGEKKAAVILAAYDGAEPSPFQYQQETLIRCAVQELRCLRQQLADVGEQLSRLVEQTDYRLTHIAGVEAVTAAELIALVGDVTRFKNVDKFLAYTGIAPVVQGTGESKTIYRSQYGRRELLSFFYRIACTQLVVHKKTGTPRNPEAKSYFDRLLGDQASLPSEKRDRKTQKKALLSLMRQQAKRFYKLMKQQKQEAVASRAGAVTEATEAPEAA
ncbi:MAG: family transposase [Symbiobacteriaceae bacterium]|jgi:transposase|nr:family transposase [Symbiobacteriaceae bacterium]